MVVVGLSVAAAVHVGGAAVAAATTCGNNGGRCNGADGDTSANISGQAAQIYWGEVGAYAHDFEGMTGPCPSDLYQACFNTYTADHANIRYTQGTGIGTQFYYLAGGAGDTTDVQKYGSAYCWGWHQGRVAVDHANASYSQYYNTAWIMTIDVEASSDWAFGDKAANRQVFNGFADFVYEQSSADPAHCPNSNTVITYQYAVYSSPYEWTNSLGSYGSSIPNTIKWTSDYCCERVWPGSFYRDSTFKANWFADTNNRDAWQFYESPLGASPTEDFDIAHEPLCLPLFGSCLGS